MSRTEPVDAHDVFISYARSDGAFVRQLQDALGERGLQTWVDWQDIAPSAEWMQEILEAIEKTDTFVFVMSPDALASTVCARELDHGVNAKKRIVPVVHRDTTDVTLEALSKRNWLFLRDGDDFEAGVDKLVETIRTDLDRVKLHTRLLVRAREWERSGNDRGKLLHGNDLTEAERFLGSSEGGVSPEESQVRYVTASRRAAGRRQRSLIAGVSIALVLSLVLASLALIQRGEARAQRDEANARALAASSVSQLELDPELSLDLALEAARISHGPEVASALRQAISASHLVRDFAIAKIGLNMHDVAVSPDGRLVAASDALGSLHVWDAETGRVIANVHHPELASDPSHLSFSSDGRTLLTSGSGLALISTDALASPGASRLLERQSVADATLLPDGRIVAVGNGVRILDPRDGHLVKDLVGTQGWTCVAVSPDGSRIAAGGKDGVGAIWSVASGRLEQRLVGHQGSITGIDFAPDGRTVATSSSDRSARVWSVRTGAQIAVLAHTAPVTAVAFGASSQVIGTGDENGVGRVWDLVTRETVATLIGHRDQISGVAFRPGTDQVVTSAFDGTVRIWRIGTALPESAMAQGAPIAATPMTDGSLAVLSKDGTASIVDPTTARATRTFKADPMSGISDPSIAADPTGRWIAASGPRGQVRVWDIRTGNLKLIGPVGDKGIEGFALFPDGTRLAMMSVPFFGSAYAGTWDVNRAVPLTASSLPPVGGTYAGEEVSPDGRTIAVSIAAPGGGQDMAVLVDANNGQEIRRFVGHDDYVVDASFSPDGRRLVTASWDGTAAIWDVATGARVTTLRGSRGPVVSADYSPDGQFLATASDDGTVRVWSADGDQIQVFRTAVHPSDAAFSADGKSIVAVGDGLVRIYRCEVCVGVDQLIALAQSRVTRDLTAEERAKYLPK